MKDGETMKDTYYEETVSAEKVFVERLCRPVLIVVRTDNENDHNENANR